MRGWAGPGVGKQLGEAQIMECHGDSGWKLLSHQCTIRLGFSTVCVADLWQTVQKKRTLAPGHLEPILRSCLGKACK